MDFDHFLIGLWHFGEIFLVHCMVSVHSPCEWTNFEGVGFQVGWWRGHSDLSWELNEGVFFWFWRSIQSNSHLSPHSLILSSPFPHIHIWWCTCWSDSCALMTIVDGQDLIYDVWICNIISILYLGINLINTCMKGSHSPCSWITSFHGFGFNLEVVLYQICMRDIIWVR